MEIKRAFVIFLAPLFCNSFGAEVKGGQQGSHYSEQMMRSPAPNAGQQMYDQQSRYQQHPEQNKGQQQQQHGEHQKGVKTPTFGTNNRYFNEYKIKAMVVRSLLVQQIQIFGWPLFL